MDGRSTFLHRRGFKPGSEKDSGVGQWLSHARRGTAGPSERLAAREPDVAQIEIFEIRLEEVDEEVRSTGILIDAFFIPASLQKDGSYYLRNVGNSLYVTLSDRDYVFTDAATPLAQIRANAAGETIDGSTTSLAGTFSILGAGGDDKHYACICTGTTPQSVRNWTFNDHGSPFYITENPNLSVTDPFLAGGIRPATALIPHDNATYLLTGQRISRPVHKGLYIRQGRLFMKK